MHELAETSVWCRHCSKDFSTQSNLNRHLVEVHGCDFPVPCSNTFDKYIFNCLEGCRVSFRRNTELRAHLQDSHNFVIEKEKLTFDSDGFHSWLKAVCAENNVQYVKSSGYKSEGGNPLAQVTYYNCHRSGKLRVIPDENRKRKLKSTGSVKLGRSCTSQIITTVVEGKYAVTFYKTHYGHTNETATNYMLPEDASTENSNEILESTMSECTEAKVRKINYHADYEQIGRYKSIDEHCHDLKEEILHELSSIASYTEDVSDVDQLSKILQVVQNASKYVQSNLYEDSNVSSTEQFSDATPHLLENYGKICSIAESDVDISTMEEDTENCDISRAMYLQSRALEVGNTIEKPSSTEIHVNASIELNCNHNDWNDNLIIAGNIISEMGEEIISNNSEYDHCYSNL